MPADALHIGLDLGTSGARAVAVDGTRRIVASCKAAMADFGANHRDPHIWWQSAMAALKGALAGIDPSRIVSLAVDGTSGTMVAVGADGTPLADGSMYNDECRDGNVLAAITRHAPETSAARGATSGLARALVFQRLGPAAILHQADWIALWLCGRRVSDCNNALKTGFDPIAGHWPPWIDATGFNIGLLPEVVEPGAPIGRITAAASTATGLPEGALLVAGTTDGCASFLATGASQVGDGVSALGSTLTLKILSDRPISSPVHGIYSHRILGKWLAGGASNSGGAALLAHFTAAQIAELTPLIDAETDTGLDYYPLPGTGERFPIADSAYAPRLTPRPDRPDDFLKGLFEGIATIERLGYATLADLGAPALRTLRSVGGGAANPVWTRIRARRLGVPMLEPLSGEAAFGTALLAIAGAAT